MRVSRCGRSLTAVHWSGDNMCRYAFKTYKPHFVCFECRKQFKRPPLGDVLRQSGQASVLQRLERAPSPAMRARVERSIGTTLESLKREYRTLVSKCPQCGTTMADLGLDFKPPPTADLRAWARIRGLLNVGLTWHTCGCSGPGFIPSNATDYNAYLERRARLFASRLKDVQNRESLDAATRTREAQYWSGLLNAVAVEQNRPHSEVAQRKPRRAARAARRPASSAAQRGLDRRPTSR
jgi:hypothetical protein